MTPDQIAPVVHEAIRSLDSVLGRKPGPSWAEATWQRESTVAAVRVALEQPSARKQHERWMKERSEAGWTYGPVKDEAAKKNPLLIPFDDLPDAEKAKDSLIIAITQALKDIST